MPVALGRVLGGLGQRAWVAVGEIEKALAEGDRELAERDQLAHMFEVVPKLSPPVEKRMSDASSRGYAPSFRSPGRPWIEPRLPDWLTRVRLGLAQPPTYRRPDGYTP